jgi:hypothetical protein
MVLESFRQAKHGCRLFQVVATFFTFAKNSRPAGAMDVKFKTAMEGGGSTQ